MNSPKNIDQLFKEKLSSFEASPDAKVWSAIESKLEKKKKRKVVPLWWFSGGVAAILVLSLFYFPFSDDTPFENSPEKQDIIIAAPEKRIENINSLKNDLDTLSKNKKNQIETVIVDNKPSIIKYKKQVLKPEDENKPNLLTADNVLQGKKHEKKEYNDVIKKDTLKKSIQKVNEKTDSIHNKQKENSFLKLKKDFITTVKKEQKENSKKRPWMISPAFAILNSSSFSNSSPLAEGLSSSTKGNSTYSYGVQVSYQLNNKWAIQSGIHIQEMSFSNNHFVVSPSNSTTSNVELNSGDSYALIDTSNLNTFSSNNFLANAVSLNGNLNQKLGYIEVPVELKYNLTNNKKFDTQLVAGFSSLFLNKNQILLNAGALSSFGKATNLNTISFSGNLGLNFSFTYAKSWSIYFNPMLKTQLNTFSKNSNGFKPYLIGFYTGIRYQL